MAGSTRQTSVAISNVARIVRAGTLVTLICSAAGSQLEAQQANLGQLSEIRGSRNKNECVVTGTSIPANPVHVNSGTTWRPLNPVFPREQLRVNDRISVRREVDARIVIDEPTGIRADITLAPKLVCSFVGVDVSAGVPADSGAYALGRSGDTVVFTVNRGAASILWTDPAKRCLLRVIAQLLQPVVARVCGTRLVVSVDATATSGYLYVEEGTVLVAGAAGVVQATQRQLIRLGGQARAILADANSAQRVDLSEIQYHSHEVWSAAAAPPPARRRFWRRPSTYVWGAIIGGATAAIIIQPWKSETVKKTVLIAIPL